MAGSSSSLVEFALGSKRRLVKLTGTPAIVDNRRALAKIEKRWSRRNLGFYLPLFGDTRYYRRPAFLVRARSRRRDSSGTLFRTACA